MSKPVASLSPRETAIRTPLEFARGCTLVPKWFRHGLAGVALGRAALLPVTALCAFASLRLVTTTVGVRGLAAVSLIATLPSLIPLGDLGVGASITDVMARHRAGKATDGELSAVVRSSLRVLVAAATAGALLVGAVSFSVDWRTLLGEGIQGVRSWSIVCALLVWVASLPLAVGQRLLLGADRRRLYLIASGLPAPTTLLFVLVGAALGWGPSYYVATSTVGILSAAALSALFAVRVGPPAVRRGCRTISRRGPGVRLRSTAVPMAVISVALPIAYQSDRLVLSHLSTASDLAIYSVGAQFFASAMAVVSVTGQFLWPRFASMRSTDGEVAARRELFRVWRIAALVGVTVAGTFALLLSPAVRIVTASRVSADPIVAVGFAATLGLHAVYYPVGMYLTSPAGLQFQAISSTAMCVVNLGLSMFLAARLGAAGPVLASAFAIAVCMFLPACLRIYSER